MVKSPKNMVVFNKNTLCWHKSVSLAQCKAREKSTCAHFPARSHNGKLSSSQLFGSARALLYGLPSRKTVINCFSLVTQRATLVVLITRRARGTSPFASKRKKHNRKGCASFSLVAEMGFEPHDLRVMSPTSYQTAPLRDMMVPEAGVEPVREKISRDFKSRASANSAIPAFATVFPTHCLIIIALDRGIVKTF